MASERHQRIKEIFLEVCELPPESRGEFIDRTCGGDAGLRAEVEGLLAQDARPSPLEALSVPRELACLGLGADPEPREEPIPETVGNYRLLRKLGEGGMGVVYEAEQKSPRRTVALKVIQKGNPSAEELAADIRRYLRNEPITARPASAVYQLNRLPLARGQNSPAARNGAGERSSRDFVTAPAEIE